MGTWHKTAKKPSKRAPGLFRYHSPNIPMAAIRRYARQIAEKFDPDKIILFGSYAYGQPHEWSDVDILVVMPARNQIDQSLRIILAVEPPFSVDLIVAPRSDSSVTGRTGTGFCGRYWPRGKVLYEKTDGSVGPQGRGRHPRRNEAWRRANRPSMT